MAPNLNLALKFNDFDTMFKMAGIVAKSGLVPSALNNQPEKICVIWMCGLEIDVPPMTALRMIDVIAGKPTISPQLMLALARRTGEFQNMKIIEEEDSATVIITRRGQEPYSYTFTMNDARSMGLITKDNWKKQPAIMRKWRAMSGCLRITFSDALAGLHTQEEMGANVEVDDDGDMRVISQPDLEQPSDKVVRPDFTPQIIEQPTQNTEETPPTPPQVNRPKTQEEGFTAFKVKIQELGLKREEAIKVLVDHGFSPAYNLEKHDLLIGLLENYAEQKVAETAVIETEHIEDTVEEIDSIVEEDTNDLPFATNNADEDDSVFDFAE